MAGQGFARLGGSERLGCTGGVRIKARVEGIAYLAGCRPGRRGCSFGDNRNRRFDDRRHAIGGPDITALLRRGPNRARRCSAKILEAEIDVLLHLAQRVFQLLVLKLQLLDLPRHRAQAVFEPFDPDQQGGRALGIIGRGIGIGLRQNDRRIVLAQSDGSAGRRRGADDAQGSDGDTAEGTFRGRHLWSSRLDHGLSRSPGATGGAFELERSRSAQDWPPLKTVTARRFCDQHEISLQTATGRSLP